MKKEKTNEGDIKIVNGDKITLIIGKNTLIGLALLIIAVTFVIVVYAMDIEIGRYGYENVVNNSGMDYVIDEIEMRSGFVKGDLEVNGSIIGGTNGIKFRVKEDKNLFSLFPFHQGMGGVGDIPEAFDDTLILQTDDISNNFSMEFCWWDQENDIMTFCSNEGAPNRATTFRRSFQIVGNDTVKESDENFTLCEDTNYIDCSTDLTGADLYVQDDIETGGSIFSNENLHVVGNLNVSGKITNSLAHIHILSTEVGSVDVGSIWYNITMNRSSLINHLFTLEEDNETFIINNTGHYFINYGAGIIDNAPSPNAHIGLRIIINGEELSGSYIEHDTTRQSSDFWLEHTSHSMLSEGDEVIFQYISDDTSVTIEQHDTFAENPFNAYVYIQELIL